MITKLNVAAAATALVIGFAGGAQAGEGSVDSNNFGNTYYGWNQPGGGWGAPQAFVSPGYSYAPGYSYGPRSYYDDDSMTGYAVRSPMIDPDADDDDDQ